MAEVKSSGTAIVLSFFWTGLGQLYAGCIGRGLLMMVATPVIWSVGFFGGLSALIGGLGAGVAPTTQESAAAGGIGLVGFVLAIAPIAWWVWGMVDAKSLCDVHNRDGVVATI